MSGKKWLLIFIAALLFSFCAWAALNLIVDPFNAFGDGVMDWDAYTQTLNPRNSKVRYVSERFDEFDSYVIGSSNAASFRPETLDSLLDGHYYNMFHYGSDTDYDRRLVDYILENDGEVKNIFLVLGLSEANSVRENSGNLNDKEHYALTGESPFLYYLKFTFASPSYAFEKIGSRMRDTELPQSFDVFLPESGCYDKRVRDVEPVGSLNDYLALHSEDFPAPSGKYDLARIDECVADVAAIKDSCDGAGVGLTVVVVPSYDGQLELFNDSSLDEFFTSLAQVTDYCNFAVSPISGDARYYYDMTHTRNSTADMVIAAVAGSKDSYLPQAFGYRCSAQSVPSVAQMREDAAQAAQQDAVVLPVLLYHSVEDSATESDTVISTAHFREHIAAVIENGYTPVTLEEVSDYVAGGSPLPDKPVLVTFDDGYMNNYENAFPVLDEYDCPAVIFAIGSSVGHYDTYKDTGLPITPHFGADEAREMTESGLISVQSHTYDMHQWEPYEEVLPARTTAMPFEDESEDDYLRAVREDARMQSECFAQNGIDAPYALAFPSGKYTTEADVALVSQGYSFTFTTESNRVNELVPGLPQTLIDLGRFNVGGDTTVEEITDYLEMR